MTGVAGAGVLAFAGGCVAGAGAAGFFGTDRWGAGFDCSCRCGRSRGGSGLRGGGARRTGGVWGAGA